MCVCAAGFHAHATALGPNQPSKSFVRVCVGLGFGRGLLVLPCVPLVWI